LTGSIFFEILEKILVPDLKITVKNLSCQICGTKIPPGGVFYIGSAGIISGSDGILPDTDKPGEIIERALKNIMEPKSEQELMDGVYQEIKLVLCSRCRIVYRNRILNMIKY
jgi:hypothetical protein